MQVKNIKDKTNRQWIIEWCQLAVFLCASLLLIYISYNLLSGFPQFITLLILYLITFVEIIIFVVRTIGVIMIFLFPDIKAKDIKFDNQKIDLILGNGYIDSYPLESINRIILSENLDGLYINANNRKEVYKLPINYKVIEKNLDDILATNSNTSLKKEKQWIESNQTELNPNKDPKGVKRNYMDSMGSIHKRLVGRKVSSVHGVEVIYYSKQ